MEDATSTDSIRPESSSDQPIIIQGVLQALETVIAAVILGLTIYYTPAVEGFFASSWQTFLLVVSFASLMVSFLLFISSLIDISCSVAYNKSSFTFLLVVSFASLMVSFLLFISSLIGSSSSVVYNKSIFLPLYLLLTSLLYLTSSIALLIYAVANSQFYNIYISKDVLPVGVRKTVYGGFNGLLAAGILGLLNSIFYLVSLMFSFRPYVKGEKSILP